MDNVLSEGSKKAHDYVAKKNFWAAEKRRKKY